MINPTLIFVCEMMLFLHLKTVLMSILMQSDLIAQFKHTARREHRVASHLAHLKHSLKTLGEKKRQKTCDKKKMGALKLVYNHHDECINCSVLMINLDC